MSVHCSVEMWWRMKLIEICCYPVNTNVIGPIDLGIMSREIS